MSSGWGGGITSASPGPSADNTYYTEQRTLTPTDISNQYVTLSTSTTNTAEVGLTVIGGPPQDNGPDFEMLSATQLSWAGKTLASLLAPGDIIVVTYPILL